MKLAASLEVRIFLITQTLAYIYRYISNDFDLDALSGQISGQPQSGPQNLERIDCMVTEWSLWSSCSATCGSGIIQKQRMIKRQPENGGKACPRVLYKKRACHGSPCL